MDAMARSGQTKRWFQRRWAVLGAAVLVVGCAQQAVVQPGHFPAPVFPLASGPRAADQIELGRLLFYDTDLSADGSVACASCHRQAFGFSDGGNRLSAGIHGKLGTRHTPALSNVAWHHTFMWDGRLDDLVAMPLAPIEADFEMASDTGAIATRLAARPEMVRAFRKAFGKGGVTGARVLAALAAFQTTLISADAPFDRMLRGELRFSEPEARGYELFGIHCHRCHEEPVMTDFTFVNIGLDRHEADPLLADVTGNPKDSGSVRIPSLRNVAASAPYMHDGRFATLEEVMAFYVHDVVDNGRLNARMPAVIELSERDQTDLIAFLHTLTDSTYLTDPRLAAPRHAGRP
jgi:cytochrome c peroxidase